MPSIRPFEIFLIQVVIYLTIWVINDYLATLISLIFGGVSLLLLTFALAVELVERSKVPKLYFFFLLVSFLAPLLTGIAYLLLNGGLNWIQE